MRAILAIASVLSLACISAHGFDNGQWNNVDPQIRQWFKSVRNPQGIPCCDTADGHPTEWRSNETGGYDAMIEGKWVAVPHHAVVRTTNPTGKAVIWYETMRSPLYAGPTYVIRCFVPEEQG
jgi:hypothetical protein